MNCNAKSLCITSIMLMTMSKNPALSQKVLENWLRLPESQELFAGLLNGSGPNDPTTCPCAVLFIFLISLQSFDDNLFSYSQQHEI